MSLQRTFSLIKPDGVRRHLIGQILGAMEESGLTIAAAKLIRLSPAQAKTFYGVHSHRPFFGELVDSITSGPVLACVLEGENAVERYRTLMGATNPKDAAPGTLRARFAVSIGENTVHGSDSLDTAASEIALFFSGQEIVHTAAKS